MRPEDGERILKVTKKSGNRGRCRKESWHRKYHSGTICKGVSNPQTSNALSGCEKEEIPK